MTTNPMSTGPLDPLVPDLPAVDGRQRMKLGLTGRIGFILVLSIVVVSFAAPLFGLPDPLAQSDNALAPPGSGGLLGTDQYGRDVLSRILLGGRQSLAVGLGAVLLASLIGVTLGAVSGFAGGRIDLVVSRFIDVMLSFPSILVALTVVGVVGAGITSLVLAIGIALSPRVARVVRGEIMSIRSRDYIEAAFASGASTFSIVMRHALPNALPVFIVLLTLELPYAILVEAALSFLGLGSSPEDPTWGRVISDGTDYLQSAFWIALFPGVTLALVVLGFNLLGDALRDVLDPKIRTRV
jgi:peptide/nickel transport system permease protein